VDKEALERSPLKCPQYAQKIMENQVQRESFLF